MKRLHHCPAPAKLNLFLHVNGRRADGYHLLQTVFQLIDHGDLLHCDLRSDGAIRRTTEVPGVPEEQDLIVRALGSMWRSRSACPWAAGWAAARRTPPRR